MKVATIFALGGLCISAYASALPGGTGMVDVPATSVSQVVYTCELQVLNICRKINVLKQEEMNLVVDLTIQIVQQITIAIQAISNCGLILVVDVIRILIEIIVQVATAYQYCETIVGAGAMAQYELQIGSVFMQMIQVIEKISSGFVVQLLTELQNQCQQAGGSSTVTAEAQSAAFARVGGTSQASASANAYAEAEAQSNMQTGVTNAGTILLKFFDNRFCSGAFKL